MKEPGLNFAIGLVVISLILLSYSIINAQPPYRVNERQGSNASIEFLLPDFDNDIGYSGWVIFVKSEVKINKGNYFIFDVPIGHGERAVSFWGDESETAIGNPYAGFRLGSNKLPLTFDIGIRVPLSSENNSLARLAGGFSDIYRLDAFILDYFTFQSMVNYRSNRINDLNGEISLGPRIWLYTGDSEYADDTEFFFAYNIKTFYSWSNFDAGVGISGLLCLTEDEFLGEDSMVNTLKFESSFATGNARPGIEISLPVDDDLDEVMDMVIGLNLKYFLD
ncbi:MAG: hypothetical protein JSU85_13565 [Candidatus Zixiibacteriota bacterium]|nr:MAG: hypothetical protein JSU85_13565 [candidate division Zixibacteria bacterium]